MRYVQYLRPDSLEEALRTLVSRAPSVIAGGTDWYPAQGEAPIKCDMLDLTQIEGLRGITDVGDGWRIGAASTWSDVIAADLPPAFDALKAASREVGSVQIQNSGTIGGNLCNASPAADGVPPLLVLDAMVELSSTRGVRVLPIDQFILGVRQTVLAADELVTAIMIPEIGDARKSAFAKLGARKYLVISIAMVAVSLKVEQGRLNDVRIAVGACSPVAQRLTALERALQGVDLEAADDLIASAEFAELSPIGDVRGSRDYRFDVVPCLIARALKDAAHG